MYFFSRICLQERQRETYPEYKRLTGGEGRFSQPILMGSKDMQQIDILRKAGDYEDYEAFRKAIGDFKLPVMSSKIFAGADEPEEIKTRVSDNRNSAKKQIKDLKEIYFAGSFEELCHEMSGTYQSGLYLEEILIRYDQIYKMKKAEKNVVDFSDFEH